MAPLKEAWTFAGFVTDFQASCHAAGLQGLQQENLLPKACQLLNSLLGVMSNSDDKAELEGVSIGRSLASACEALKVALNDAGLSWLKSLFQSCENHTEAVKKAHDVLGSPTPFLTECLQTCSLCNDDLAAVDFGAKLGDLVGFVPLLLKVSSIKEDLMQQLSPERLGLCKKFTSDFEEKLVEHLDSMKATVAQLQKLEDKYKCLGPCFFIFRVTLLN